MVVGRLPAAVPGGSAPKPSSTLSPSSSALSSVAVTVIVFAVSAGPKVTETGTPE